MEHQLGHHHELHLLRSRGRQAATGSWLPPPVTALAAPAPRTTWGDEMLAADSEAREGPAEDGAAPAAPAAPAPKKIGAQVRERARQRQAEAAAAAAAAREPEAQLQLLDFPCVEQQQFGPCLELHGFLRQNRLERYIAVFDEQEVSFALLRTLSEDDLLTKLRLPFGPARTIINALRAESELDDSDLSSSLASFRLLTDGP